jgi:hypothetical protein
MCMLFRRTSSRPSMCVCCSRVLNWWMVVNMSMSLFRRLVNRSDLRKMACACACVCVYV